MIAPYLTTIVWIALLSWCLNRHLTALRRYSRQAHVIREAERAGYVEVGSTLVAKNQRYRYAVRSGMAVFGLALGAMGLYAVRHPIITQAPWYGYTVLGYLYLTEMTTGWLTVRDLRILERIGLIDSWTAERNGLHRRIDELHAQVKDLSARLSSPQ